MIQNNGNLFSNRITSTGDMGASPWVRKIPYRRVCSPMCFWKSMDRGAQWAIIHWAAKSWHVMTEAAHTHTSQTVLEVPSEIRASWGPALQSLGNDPFFFPAQSSCWQYLGVPALLQSLPSSSRSVFLSVSLCSNFPLFFFLRTPVTGGRLTLMSMSSS